MSAVYLSDKNHVGMKFESGAYANTSGNLQWIGEVQSHDVDVTTNVQPIRYLDGDDRNVEQFQAKALDVVGTFTYFPQDWRLLGFALGSITDAGSPSPYIHNMSEVNSGSRSNAYTSGALNPFISFGVEDTHIFQTGQNFQRKVFGATVDTFTLNMKQGEILTADVGYKAQYATFGSGAESSLTAATTRPFMFSDVKLHSPSGTILQTFIDGTFSVNNNLNPKHYLNGSIYAAVMTPLGREYELNITLEGNTTDTGSIWSNNFISGNQFNMMLEINAQNTAGAGSRDCYIILSGCQVMDMKTPSPVEGTNENTISIKPSSCFATSNDLIYLYNEW